ncbi:MAG TPA: S41 family peptidase [Patescibacteria group bacterium]|nr:S41 family peptidase [Patescibacteria group bacterium]
MVQEEIVKIDPKEKRNGSNRFIVVIVIMAFIANAIGFFIIGAYFATKSPDIVKQKLVNTQAPVKYKDIDFSRFWEAVGMLEAKYIGDVDYSKLVDGAIAGMTASLGDPFTTYFDTKTLGLFNSEVTGTFEGIGAEVTARDGKLVVIAPLEGAPAEKAGVKPGDIIGLIDGKDVSSMTIDEAILMMRGKKGTEVKLSIIRGTEKPIELTIKRDVINVKSVEYKQLDGGVAYVRVLRFDNTTKSLFDLFVSEIKKNGSKGLILDLRNNPGGYLDAAVDLSSEFIKDGPIVIEQYKDGRRDTINATGKGNFFDIPMNVLVNEGSASGSEIVAGAIKDLKRGLLIGEKTFGKGSVQEMTPLTTGGALKITVAKWLTPNGTTIDKNGLNPDIEVKYEDSSDINKDNQLDRAVEEIKKLIK